MTSLLHHAVEGPFADDRTSVFPPSYCCWQGSCSGGLHRLGGRLRGLVRGATRRRQRVVERQSCTVSGPLPRAREQLFVHASASGLPLLGAHVRLSVCVSRGTPTCCGSESWLSSCQCLSQAVCGFLTVWVICRGVCCGLCLVVWGWGGAGAGRRHMLRCQWRSELGGSPHSVQAPLSPPQWFIEGVGLGPVSDL
jgi:hypothetical protein